MYFNELYIGGQCWKLHGGNGSGALWRLDETDTFIEATWEQAANAIREGLWPVDVKLSELQA